MTKSWLSITKNAKPDTLTFQK